MAGLEEKAGENPFLNTKIIFGKQELIDAGAKSFEGDFNKLLYLDVPGIAKRAIYEPKDRTGSMYSVRNILDKL
jgi:hypothetical protein